MGQRIDNASDKRFDILKRRLQSDVKGQTQQQQEGLKRRFAAIGGLSSGAAIKQQQLAEQRGGQQLQRAGETVELARLGEQARQQEVEAGRKFQAGESALQRKFAGEQAGLGREFATSERLGSQEYGGAQSQLARNFAANQSKKGRQHDRTQFAAQRDLTFKLQKNADAFKQQAFDFQKTQAGLQWDQVAFENRLNEQTLIFNRNQAKKASGGNLFSDTFGSGFGF